MSSATAFLPSARVLDYDQETDQFTLTISARDRDLAAQVAGMRFHKPTETWRGAPTLANAFALRGVFGNALDVTDAAYARVQGEVDNANTVQAWKDGDTVPPPHEGTEGLFPEQRPAAHAAALQGYFLNGDDKGSGKTVMAAGAMNLAQPWPALVVATASMKYTWQAEVEKWCGVSVAVMGRTKGQRLAAIKAVADGEAQVLICGWEQLRLHSALAGYGSVRRTDAEKEPKELNEIPWQAVIADEAHRAKNPKAKQTRALWEVSKSATFRWPLTATPITGNTIDLWGILHFMDPEAWPSRSKFIDRYVLTHVNHWGAMEDLGLNPRNEAELRQILEPHYIRRKLDLPIKALEPQFRFVDMEGEQRRVYKQMERESITQIDDRFLVAVGPLTVNTRLQQLAQATPVIDDDGEVIGMKRPSCKYDALVDLLEEMEGDPLVVFSDSRKLLQLCYSELTADKGPLTTEEVGRVYGGISEDERARDVAAFQDGKLKVILCSIMAAAEGITLTRASTLCFLNRSYRAVLNNQAEGRVLRHGQTRNVQIIDIITRESEEYRVHESSAAKEQRLQDFHQDEDWMPRVVPTETD